ncbi:MAG: hypothetical protein ABI140_19415 [Jatrophihabitantaceae bacterium]
MLNEIEQRLTVLANQRVAEQLADPSHVTAQGGVVVTEGEFFAGIAGWIERVAGRCAHYHLSILAYSIVAGAAGHMGVSGPVLITQRHRLDTK